MAPFMHTVRFVVGMAMLAGGVLLAQPFVSAVVAARAGREAARAEGIQRPVATPPSGAHPVPSMMVSVAGGHAIPDGRPVVSREDMVVSPDAAGQMATATPPPPPTPLPASGIDLSPASPALDGTYRSTVDIPPPPLLDVHAPPPLSAGWTPHEVARPAATTPTTRQATQPANARAEYVVRDGDDLTGIALRVYGHAGAATAIWTANRDRLADPHVLPIGMPLRLPPSWTLSTAQGSHAAGGGQSIEPTFTAAVGGGAPRDDSAAPAEVPAPREGEGASWLQGGLTRSEGQHAIPTQAAGHRPSEQARSTGATPVSRPAAVRVGLGDSLESLAVRFYGDRSMASRIWMANRDRLRSPDLLVPGVELRLP